LGISQRSANYSMKVLLATAIYPTAENPAWGTFVRTQVEYLKRAGVIVELLLVQGRPQKLMYAKAALELRRRLAEDSIDLVHAHYSYVGMISRMQWKVPVVVSYCGDDILGTISANGKPTVFSKVAVMAGRILSHHTDAVIVKSQEMANKLKQKNAYVIPHEIDFEVFHPVKKAHALDVLGLDPRKKYLLFAANPQIPVKRFPLAKAVADELKKQDPSVELIVVYKEPQNRLTFFMNACDALVFTSYQEGSPNVVKQAMACNLPIVTTDVGDVREVIGSTKGCYVSKPDVGEFVKGITEILRHCQRTRGHEQVQHLAGPVVAQRIVQVYEQVLKRREVHGINRVQTDPFTGK
jgi:glycosyltransferase involved in cell wall biosynthesis